MSDTPKHILQIVQTSDFRDEMKYFDTKAILAELLSFVLVGKFPASCGSTATNPRALHWTSTSASWLQPTPWPYVFVTPVLLHTALPPNLFHTALPANVLYFTALPSAQCHCVGASFDSGPVDVGFMVDALALGHLSFLQVRRFPPRQYHSTNTTHSFIHG